MRVEAIKLPGCLIELDELTLSRSIRFVGCPGSELSILKGSIRLRPESAPAEMYFKECSLTIKVPFDRSPEPRALFEVGNKATLHLRDCQLKAEYTPAPPPFIISEVPPPPGSEQVKDVCIHILPSRTCVESATLFNDNKQICLSVRKPAAGGSVTACSSSFLQFYTHVLVGKDGNFRAEKSGFFRSKGTAIVAVNPHTVDVEGSRFENLQDGAVEIKWDTDVVGELSAEREVRLEDNDINSVRTNGIALTCELVEKQQLSANVNVIGNRVQGCKQDGIAIKGMQGAVIEVRQNSVTSVMGNGISVFDSRCSTLRLKLNSLRDNAGCGVCVSESSCRIQFCDCSSNGQSGVAIIGHNGGVQKGGDEGNVDVELLECTLSENKQHGLAAVDICGGSVSVTRCRLNGNKEYGLFLCHNDNLSTAISQSLSMSTAMPVSLRPAGKVVITGGEVKLNRHAGVYVSQMFTHIDSAAIKDNWEYAIFLPFKRSEKYVAFAGSTIGKKCIQGVIGGKWGKVSIYPAATKCGACSCAIL